ncbi:uncharacterized protein [Gossypium hirsutum]|uniref:Reverse transcriptase n=1 Tax=Gossypium hirsutum TaxID=3635 RepID=A0A1U8IZI0_GOSHI|nr:uncharacterized protein LOC107900161 [Gossypium hirsutum]
MDPSDYLLQTETKDFYKKLWSLQLPSKIAFTVWRISWDFIPSFVKLRKRRVVSNDRCPRCNSEVEGSLHVFRDCPTTAEVWHLLNFAWAMKNRSHTIWEWLTWVFKRGNNDQCFSFCYALWWIWFSRNQLIHERNIIPGRALVLNIQQYVSEQKGLNGLKTKAITCRSYRVQELTPTARIHFDAAYDSNTSSSASSLVGWDMRGVLIALKTIIHRNVPSPFAAEAHACLEGVKLGISLQIHSVKLMGDSKTVIKKCQETSTDKSVIGAIIRDIQQKKSDFQDLIFQYIHRSENLDAHRIAKIAFEKGETFYLRGEELDSQNLALVGYRPRNPD